MHQKDDETDMNSISANDLKNQGRQRD